MKIAVLLCLLIFNQTVGKAKSALAQVIVAHRGASADAPENSISSFNLAWKQGADAVEGDFYLTADKHIVCIHDKDTQRVSGEDLEVSESTLEVLQKLDVGSWKGPQFCNERMPTLQEVLAVIPSGKILYIEIKCGPEILPYLKPLLMGSKLEAQQLRIISFNKDVIRTSKLVMPSIEAYWLVDFQKDNDKGLWYPSVDVIVDVAQRIGADGVDVRAKMDLLDPQFISRCQEAGLSLHAWTVDDSNDARELQRLGFDSITTNRPEFLRQAISQLENMRSGTSSFQTPAVSHTERPSSAIRMEASTE
ncbi:glycerophosphodiester phosphodiesterase [Bythopirellula polymerisocia]|uniref:Glycerophosphoryl diester phosphodiesterase n=1 Tax=Bythopirellula polymerisocia TaxID=2528003 RepID=A0A5C6CNX5_9BACT|nr:glycerophosphodiester phosphodiesterase [Bythopirellula polymerisocia]TWU26088.1 Glycerophosphoryl diester phosphodiesterase [Bythopirellula polymerisocia]